MHDGRPSLARKVKKKPGKEIKPSEQSSKGLPLLNKESAKTQLNTARAVLINQVKIGRLTFSSGEEGFFLNSIDSLFSKGHFISFCGVSALRKLLGIGHGSISPGGWAKQHPETEGGATGRDLARYVENANAGVRLHDVEKDGTKELTLESMWGHFGMSTDHSRCSSLCSFVVNMERSSKSNITMLPNLDKCCGDRWRLSLGSGRAILACMG
jgi:hypothetical protein